MIRPKCMVMSCDHLRLLSNRPHIQCRRQAGGTGARAPWSLRMHANFADLTPDGFHFCTTLSPRTSEPVRHASVPPTPLEQNSGIATAHTVRLHLLYINQSINQSINHIWQNWQHFPLAHVLYTYDNYIPHCSSNDSVTVTPVSSLLAL